MFCCINTIIIITPNSVLCFYFIGKLYCIIGFHFFHTSTNQGSLDLDTHIFRRDINRAVDPFSMKIGVKQLAKNKKNRSVEERDFANRCSFLKIDETAGKTARAGVCFECLQPGLQIICSIATR